MVRKGQDGQHGQNWPLTIWINNAVLSNVDYQLSTQGNLLSGLSFIEFHAPFSK